MLQQPPGSRLSSHSCNLCSVPLQVLPLEGRDPHQLLAFAFRKTQHAPGFDGEADTNGSVAGVICTSGDACFAALF